VIVFSSKKASVDQLTREFQKLGIQAEAIHSGLEQSKREKVLQDFTNRQIHVLVATDVVSRGIDITGIEMVVNYNVPQDAEDYVHRIGRTARASSDGIAFTFINEDDMNRFGKIEKLIEKEIRKVKLPAHLGDGPVYDPNRRESKPFRGKKKGRR
jgi:ATP-dependent RNA helicase RhlE